MPTKFTQARSRRKASNGKPDKPYDGFPLFPHASGRWAKKIRGKVHYFGQWGKRVNGQLVRVDGDGWEAAVELYDEQKADLHAGRTPRDNPDALTIADLCNHFLIAKENRLKSGELSNRSWLDYNRVAKRLTAFFGRDRLVDDLTAADFEELRSDIAESWGPVALGNEIQRIRSIFKHGYDEGHIEKEVRYGSGFKKPSRKVIRKERAERGSKMLEPDEIRSLLDVASDQLKAMILLAVNAGFGNSDCGNLPLRALDLDGGWIDYPRPKTGIERRCKLWPETIEALRAVLADRKAPHEAAYKDRVFVTKYGKPWHNGNTSDPISAETRKLMQRPRCPKCGKINDQGAKKCSCGWKPKGKDTWKPIHRTGCGFYALRHVFRTIADGCRDFPPIDHVMGHARDDMASVYRERIDDDRLEAVADHVRGWLFGGDE